MYRVRGIFDRYRPDPPVDLIKILNIMVSNSRENNDKQCKFYLCQMVENGIITIDTNEMNFLENWLAANEENIPHRYEQKRDRNTHTNPITTSIIVFEYTKNELIDKMNALFSQENPIKDQSYVTPEELASIALCTWV